MPLVAPVDCHDHPLFHDAASAVRDDTEKLLAKLRRAHALAERYCSLGTKLAAVSSELASELVASTALYDSPGLSGALGVLASEAEAEAGMSPKTQLSTLAAALAKTSLASEMLAAQLRAIVSEPLRELLEDAEGLAAVGGKHAELASATHAFHEVLLDTLRPGVGAGSRPRASDLSKGAASATVAAKVRRSAARARHRQSHAVPVPPLAPSGRWAGEPARGFRGGCCCCCSCCCSCCRCRRRYCCCSCCCCSPLTPASSPPALPLPPTVPTLALHPAPVKHTHT
jgi:hypothetical protein